MIFAYGGVCIGDNCTMSTGSKIYSLTSLPHNPFNRKEVVSIMPYSGVSPTLIGPVVLKNNVWLGINVCIFPGVTLGENSFVRTNSIVQDSFDQNSYIAGDPAEYVKPRFE
jgi:acetyltransferase-like isoleucine patch superfamily enzyme